MLKVEAIDSYYGEAQVLRGASLTLEKGEVLCLLGRNGAGKTTLLKAIMGLVRPREGRVMLGEVELSSLPAHEVARHGIGYVPQGRRLFGELSVAENLEIGLMTRGKSAETRERVLDLFALLRDRLAQRSGTLSGGEQQMLAIGRALCLEPDVLLLDEPTEGLMPAMIARILETVVKLKETGVGIILVEQRVEAVMQVASRVTFMEGGATRETLTPAELARKPALLDHYVGVGLARR
jgi:branched-chain amino acid transport system ATP-binding protein